MPAIALQGQAACNTVCSWPLRLCACLLVLTAAITTTMMDPDARCAVLHAPRRPEPTSYEQDVKDTPTGAKPTGTSTTTKRQGY